MRPPLVAVLGALDTLSDAARATLLDRSGRFDPRVTLETRAILDDVRRRGDAALRDLARRFDGVALADLEVPRAARLRALAMLDPALRDALARAAENIRLVHAAFRPRAVEVVTPDGVRIGRRPDPLARAGVYAPGGSAAYASSVLMGVIPARVAGVDEVLLCSPPAPDGLPGAVVLAAAEMAGADRVFAAGGAGAIAAMAFGTGTIPRVDRIVGPGNAWVAEAKAQVAGLVGIDAPAGPSELLVIADAGADAGIIARELVAQAEHDPLAAVALITTSAQLAAAVGQELERLVEGTPRETIIRQALAARGAILTAASLAEALRFAEAYAPEHLLLACRNADAIAAGVRNAGAIFIGAMSSVTFGDYITGANHILPTGGAARAWSGLSTQDFYRWTTWQDVPEAAARALRDTVAILARAEGLPAHAAAVAVSA